MRILIITIFLLFICAEVSFTQATPNETEKNISKQLRKLRTAHLTSSPELADGVYDKKLILTSQSGKLYSKKEALLNIRNKFEFYENSDILFLHPNKEVVIVNFINERKIKGFGIGKYRVTSVWVKKNGDWKIISLQSSKVRVRNK